VSGTAPPTAATAGTYLASTSADGLSYFEYGSYDAYLNYQSPGDVALNPDMYTTTVATPSSTWDKYGKMYSNAAVSARPSGAAPLLATTAPIQNTNSPVFSYKCTAKKLIPVDPNKSSASAIFISTWFVLFCFFTLAFEAVL
jgi:hypothetical protein